MSNTQAEAAAPINITLLLIGNSYVGKSSLLRRFSDKQWNPEMELNATVGVDYGASHLVTATFVQQKLVAQICLKFQCFLTNRLSFRRGTVLSRRLSKFEKLMELEILRGTKLASDGKHLPYIEGITIFI